MKWKVAAYAALVVLGALSSIYVVENGDSIRKASTMEGNVGRTIVMDVKKEVLATGSPDPMEGGEVQPEATPVETVPMEPEAGGESEGEAMMEPETVMPTPDLEERSETETPDEPPSMDGDGVKNREGTEVVAETTTENTKSQAKAKDIKASPKPTKDAGNNGSAKASPSPKKKEYAKANTNRKKESIPKQIEANAHITAGQAKAVKSAVVDKIKSAGGGASYSTDLENAAILRSRGVGKSGIGVLVEYGGAGWKNVKWGETKSHTFARDFSEVDKIAETLFQNLSRSTYLHKGYKNMGVGVHVNEEGSSLKITLTALFTN